MSVGLILIKAAVTSVVFVVVYWIFNLIWGDGQEFTAGSAIAAVISGLIFFLIYSVSTYFFERNKRKRSA
jgi:sterol desaturase/sphingolipid hydroxylase (fatty acid hydroxylase superfamily)